MTRKTAQVKQVDTDEPDPNKFFKWTVEIEINEVWVADGFEVTAERVQEMIQEAIGYSLEPETRVHVIAAPDPKEIRRAQGYGLVEDTFARIDRSNADTRRTKPLDRR